MTRVPWMQVLALLLAAASADARTWRVEKDGSGDFTRLYEACVAAVSGDTITIGPGVYVSTPEHDFGSGPVEVHGFALVEQLTILGAGSEHTILGAPTGPGGFDSPFGIISFGSARLTVRGIGFQDLGEAIQASGLSVAVSECAFLRNRIGVASACSDFQSVEDCTFENEAPIVFSRACLITSNLPSRRARLERCVFRGIGSGVQVQSKESVVRDCSFERQSLSVALGGEVLVEGCDFVGPEIGGAHVLTPTSRMEMRGSNFADLGRCLSQQEGGELAAFENRIGAGIYETIGIDGRGVSSVLQSNHILNGGGLSVAVDGNRAGFPIVHHDLRRGTDDPAQIAAWIHDANDDPNLAAIIDFEPFSPVPLAARPKSFGELRALFGPREEP